MELPDQVVKRDGQWDPDVDAYVVTDPGTGQQRYFAWTRPPLIVDALGAFAVGMVRVVGAVIVFNLFAAYPDGVAGDRQAQLEQALQDKYGLTANFVPTRWTDTQVFAVDVEQNWDSPNYDQPKPTAKGCQLQPGRTDEELDVQCRDSLGTFYEVRQRGANAREDSEHRQRLEQYFQPEEPDTSQGATGDGGAYDSDPGDYYDPYDHYDPYDYYEDQEPEIFP